MSSKSKSSLSESPSSNASSTATSKFTRLPRSASKAEPGSPSLQKSRLSNDSSPKASSTVHSPFSRTASSRMALDTRSPKSINFPSYKQTTDRRSPKTITPPERRSTHVAMGSEVKEQLNVAQEDLKKTKEQLSLVEKEKAEALIGLKEAQKNSDETNERLKEALLAQKKAEEGTEIEKFRAIEIEQSGIEAVQKKEFEWKKEVESVKSQHSLDAAALFSITEELQRAKKELAVNCDARNKAMSHADDATKIADIHAQKVEQLSSEIAALKASLDLKTPDIEIDYLKQEIEKARNLSADMVEREGLIEKLHAELNAARMAESIAHDSLEKVEKERDAASESLNSVMKQFEVKNNSLQDVEEEINYLKEKVGLLEMSIRQEKSKSAETEHRLGTSMEEASAMVKIIESLKLELETLKAEKAGILKNEKMAATSIEKLLAEKNKLLDELQNSKAEEDKSKKAMEGLAAALHEVSMEGRVIKENLISCEAERENYGTQLEDLNLALKTTKERYETETSHLKNTIEEMKCELQSSKAREFDLANHVKKSDDEVGSLITKVNCFKITESQVMSLKEESMNQKKALLEREDELQSAVLEINEFREREIASVHKIAELSKQLDEALAKKQCEETGGFSDSEKDYDMLPKVVEFSEENGHGNGKEDSEIETTLHKLAKEEDNLAKSGEVNGREDEVENKKTNEEDESVEGEYKMWESCKIGEKDFSPESDLLEDEELKLKEKTNSSESMNDNGRISTSPTKTSRQKKKKHLLRKFESLLKRKGNSDP